MKKYEHLKEKAIKLRGQGDSLITICDKLNISKSTAYGWIKEIPVRYAGKNRNQNRTEKQIKSQKKAALANMLKHKKLREEAYNSSLLNAEMLLKNDMMVRDFTNIYLGEGYRKSRHVVSVANSNPKIIKLSYFIISMFSKKECFFNLQYHADQNPEDLKTFWSQTLNINIDKIRILRKSNSNNLSGRNWASKFGVFTVGVHDTYFRCKVQAWMDTVQKQWEVIIDNAPNNYFPITVENIKNSNRKVQDRPSRIKLIELILNHPFTKIGELYDVSDNAVRKWCKSENLPSKSKDIKAQRTILEEELHNKKEIFS